MTVTLPIIPDEYLNFVVEHEVVDDKVGKVYKKISVKAMVEVQFCNINNFVNDCVIVMQKIYLTTSKSHI